MKEARVEVRFCRFMFWEQQLVQLGLPLASSFPPLQYLSSTSRRSHSHFQNTKLWCTTTRTITYSWVCFCLASLLAESRIVRHQSFNGPLRKVLSRSCFTCTNKALTWRYSSSSYSTADLRPLCGLDIEAKVRKQEKESGHSCSSLSLSIPTSNSVQSRPLWRNLDTLWQQIVVEIWTKRTAQLIASIVAHPAVSSHWDNSWLLLACLLGVRSKPTIRRMSFDEEPSLYLISLSFSFSLALHSTCALNFSYSS